MKTKRKAPTTCF